MVLGRRWDLNPGPADYDSVLEQKAPIGNSEKQVSYIVEI
jgi:hypothetical protein